ncbi:carboxypeptidase N subunit 2-like [Photinus pyralis]|nr:carboxypeptidase N subunit 2-like [Photinus pyralis]
MQCTVSSFENNVIKVNGDTKTISGCISPETIQFNGTISNIDVKNQDIQDLNYGAVQRISSNFRIDFSNTNIRSIRAGAFLDLPQLAGITVVGNELFWINENAFQDLPWLNRVDLSYNKITDVSPRAFNNLPNLYNVSFYGNRLGHFDQSWFYKTPDLGILSLAYNRLRRIPQDAFTHLPAIRALWLNSNEIQFIEKYAFKGLRDLEDLDLSRNKLKSFAFNFYAPSSLHKVYIENNNITYISDEVLDVIRSALMLLTIDDNPLQCACLDKVMEWSDAFNIRVPQKELQGSSPICTVPKTNPNQCLERSDDDFQKGFWVGFERAR